MRVRIIFVLVDNLSAESVSDENQIINLKDSDSLKDKVPILFQTRASAQFYSKWECCRIDFGWMSRNSTCRHHFQMAQVIFEIVYDKFSAIRHLGPVSLPASLSSVRKSCKFSIFDGRSELSYPMNPELRSRAASHHFLSGPSFWSGNYSSISLKSQTPEFVWLLVQDKVSPSGENATIKAFPFGYTRLVCLLNRPCRAQNC